MLLGTGTYGAELTNCLQRQGKSERDRLWQSKPRIPISNRIDKSAAGGRFGDILGEGADEVSITLADCIALDATRYKAHRRDGEKLETQGEEPRTMACFIASVKQNIRLFCMLFGEEHPRGEKALKNLIWHRDRKPELSTATFLVGCWNRFCYEYTDAERGGVRTMIRMLPEGAYRDAFASPALSPCRHSGKRIRRRPSVFSFKAANGMWRGRILPEVEEQLESSRISGSASQRNTLNVPPPTPSETPTPLTKEEKKAKWGRKRKKKQDRRATGGQLQNQKPDTKLPTGVQAGDLSYPPGKRLRASEFEASKLHGPRDSASGKPF